MRKRNPNDVIDDFQDLLATSLANWRLMCAQVSGNDLRKNASVDTFLNAAIGWESFLSDWHIAAINRDSTNFVASLTARVEQSVTGSWPGLKGRLSVSIPKHPSLDLIREIVDPEGGNLSFGKKGRWTERAKSDLADPYKTNVLAVPATDQQLILAVVTIRDCISHRSQKSSDAMNDALAQLKRADAELRRGTVRVTPSGIGAYLHAVAAGTRRVERYHHRLDHIAESLRV